MADANEPKEETIGIDLLPESESEPGPDTKSRETVRIQLGLRQTSDRLPSRIPAEPSPVFEPAAQVLTSAEDFPTAPATASPKNETARVARMPDLPPKSLPTVQMKKTQPLIAMPHNAPRNASIAVAPAEKSAMRLCWMLLGISAIILIIQIWTYLS